MRRYIAAALIAVLAVVGLSAAPLSASPTTATASAQQAQAPEAGAALHYPTTGRAVMAWYNAQHPARPWTIDQARRYSLWWNATVLNQIADYIRAVTLARVLQYLAIVQANSIPYERNWDRVAACESGGNWAINTGNGFYGGLQFDRGTWLGSGGGAYAPTANLASKAAQVRIAERVRAARGLSPWPHCGSRWYG